MTDQPTTGRHRRMDAPVAAPPAQPHPRGRILEWVALVTAALCLPAVAAVVLLYLQVRHDDSQARQQRTLDAARAQAMKAGSDAAEHLLSYDYRTIGKDIATATALTTGAFHTQYANLGHQLAVDAPQVHAIVQAVVSNTGVIDATPSRVVLLLFVDQASVKQLPGQRSPTTRIDQSRVRMTLSRVRGRWLVSELNPV